MRVMRLGALASAAALWLGGGGFSPAGAQDGADLPAGEGRDAVEVICSGCHSLRLVKQQGMSRSRWDKTLQWMVEQQGMPELDPETRNSVLDYLAAHFNEESRGPGEGLSPFNQVQPLQPETQ